MQKPFLEPGTLCVALRKGTTCRFGWLQLGCLISNGTDQPPRGGFVRLPEVKVSGKPIIV